MMNDHSVSSENKDTAYIATVLLFNQVQIMAMEEVGGWELESTITDTTNNHYQTKYNNGKMWIMATSQGDNHIYSFGSLLY